MKRESVVRIQDLVGLVHALYPPALAEEWDNVGLQVGDPAAPVERALICLDPTERALDAASEAGAKLLITHHPLIFKPLKSLVPIDATGRFLFRAVREGIGVLSVHTNLDRAAGGLNDWLADRVGLDQRRPLLSAAGDLHKLVVFVPAGHEDSVAEALFSAGAGRVGNYDRCSFRSAGTGSFRPGPGTRPFRGRVGEDERAEEVRLETILPREGLNRAVTKMIKVHPYEEVAYDLIPLGNRRGDVGLGRIGRLAEATTLGVFAERVKKALGAPALRLVGEPGRKIRKVALCGGSGASVLAEAARQGADLLLTGDVKYHEAQSAENQGVAIIDAGHFATEHLMVKGLARALGKAAETRRITVEFLEMEGEQDPFRVI
ncbi:Nif3-like dinuclear metal center hexameric protein [uncultured Desulfuromonas sp.]|uniref:Nif3-like dinuclear metal center hexameric protein n=1 Tax=uncultured Desulfuromonas sp. TaxID=181013 RepID=UPI00260F23AF|nr:Nif3-like dinuclear metal center hexameric protein [uncultured Desulfuromonas sp.]